MKDHSARMTGFTGMMKTAMLTSGFEAIAFWLAAHYMTAYTAVAWIGFGMELVWFVTSALVYVITSVTLILLAQEEKVGGNRIKSLS